MTSELELVGIVVQGGAVAVLAGTLTLLFKFLTLLNQTQGKREDALREALEGNTNAINTVSGAIATNTEALHHLTKQVDDIHHMTLSGGKQ